MANDSLATYRQFKPEASMLLGGCHTHIPRHSRIPCHSRAGGNPVSALRKIDSRLRGNDKYQCSHIYQHIENKPLEAEQHNPRHSRTDGNPARILCHSRAGGNPSLGLLLCKEKDKLEAEYALTDVNKPIGISAYQLTQALPDNLKSRLPSIEEIEAELARDLGVGDE